MKNPPSRKSPPVPDPAGPMAPSLALPPLMRLNSGQAVRSVQDWQQRRQELLALAHHHVYGELPPPGGICTGVLLHEAANRRLRGGVIQSWQVRVDGRAAFTMRVMLPPGPGPFPALICGDACWGYVGDAVQRTVLGGGLALVLFNRAEVMSDVPGERYAQTRCEALQGYGGGSIAAWAWAFHRGADVLCQHAAIHAEGIAVVGHSRGGKAALLAGATDTRIALTSANNSGAGGAGCWRLLGPGVERLQDITRNFPAWFSPALAALGADVQALPFDQHMLKALVAPRYLLSTEALGDKWANPEGSRLTHEAAREAYQFLGADDRIAIRFRKGGHAHTLADWVTLLAGVRQALGHGWVQP